MSQMTYNVRKNMCVNDDKSKKIMFCKLNLKKWCKYLIYGGKGTILLFNESIITVGL